MGQTDGLRDRGETEYPTFLKGDIINLKNSNKYR